MRSIWLRLGVAAVTSMTVGALVAGDADTSISLELSALKPLVLHGNHGLDSKGPEPGNASFYYSFPRLGATGSITVAGESALRNCTARWPRPPAPMTTTWDPGTSSGRLILMAW